MTPTALPPLTWTLTPVRMPASLKAEETVGRFLMKGTGVGGNYRLGVVNSLSQDETVEISYAPPLPEGLTLDEGYARYAERLKANPADPHLSTLRLALELSSNELGRIATLPLALGVIEAWRQHPESAQIPLEAQIVAAGFQFKYRLDQRPMAARKERDLPDGEAVDPGCGHRVYRQTDAEQVGFYSLFLNDHSLHLTYERDDQDGHHNLVWLRWGAEAGTREPAPVWPTDRGNPRQMAMTAALQVLKGWERGRALSTGLRSLPMDFDDD
jgi:hypothetical protein